MTLSVPLDDKRREWQGIPVVLFSQFEGPFKLILEASRRVEVEDNRSVVVQYFEASVELAAQQLDKIQSGTGDSVCYRQFEVAKRYR